MEFQERMELLERAKTLSERDRKKKRRGYSQGTKEALQEAVKEHSKAAVAKATGVSYATLHRIVGRRDTRTGPSIAIGMEITITLPSRATLRYANLSELRADAKVLSRALSSLG